MRERTDDAWFTNWRNAADQVGQITLVCLPHAGAGASVYARWATLLPPWIDLVGITLPGRESRISESPLTSMDEVISRLGPAVSARVQEPFALFGHSLGALIGYELACWLGTRCSAARPELLVVSGQPRRCQASGAEEGQETGPPHPHNHVRRRDPAVHGPRDVGESYAVPVSEVGAPEEVGRHDHGLLPSSFSHGGGHRISPSLATAGPQQSAGSLRRDPSAPRAGRVRRRPASDAVRRGESLQ